MPDDPRNSALETSYTLPKSWRGSSMDTPSSLSMLLAGATMLTRNKLLGWGALLMAIAGALNQTPLRTKESSMGGVLSSLMFSFACLVATYIPTMIINPNAAKLAQDAGLR